MNAKVYEAPVSTMALRRGVVGRFLRMAVAALAGTLFAATPVAAQKWETGAPIPQGAEEVYGMASVDYPIIAVAPGLKGKVRRNVIYHEIAHHLFPYRPHWWIECYAERMAGGGGRGYWSKRFDHSLDEMPSRQKLLYATHIAVKRFNNVKKRL